MKDMQLLKNFIYGILSVQEKFLKYRLSKTVGVKNKSKRRRHFSDGCIIDLNSLADIEKDKLESEITNILKSNEYNPDRVLEYIKKQG